MELFDTEKATNILPYGGTATYHGRVMSSAEANDYFDRLMDTIAWKHDEAVIFGRHIITKRMVAWYGDKQYAYTYSNTTKEALLWTPELLRLKGMAEQVSDCAFNSCLLNLYHDGDEGMAWHSDDEKALGKNSTIASFSFGAERRFCFKHRTTKEQLSLNLENGSILLMKDATQTNWLHSLPKSKKVKHARINLTFRTMMGKGI